MYEGGWILLDERAADEIALGLVGKFWRPVIEFARSADDYRDFDEPGFAKTVYDLSVREVNANRTLLSGPMRTATTDEHARRWFRRCWTFGVGSGAHILVGAPLDSARRAAEGDHNGYLRRGMEGGMVKSRPMRPLDAARAFGVMLSGSVALAAAAAASTGTVARAVALVAGPPTSPSARSNSRPYAPPAPAATESLA